MEEIPTSTLVHRTVGCPWSLKGTVMRTITEDVQRARDGKVSLLDGIMVVSRDSWVQILPDADEPVFHVYAEGASSERSEELAEQLRRPRARASSTHIRGSDAVSERLSLVALVPTSVVARLGPLVVGVLVAGAACSRATWTAAWVGARRRPGGSGRPDTAASGEQAAAVPRAG